MDIASRKTAETLSAHVRGANRLKFTPDSRLVFVSSLGTGDLAVFDSGTKKEVKRIRLDHSAAGILMQPDGSRVYIACSPDHNVAVIDLAKLEVIGRIETGRGPDGLAGAVR